MKRIIFMTIATAALLACSGADTAQEAQQQEQPVPISLACALDRQTRAYTVTQGTLIAAGRTVSVWGDEHVDKTSSTVHTADVADYLKAWQLTTDGTGALASTSTQYYPMTGNNLDLYALHGNFNNAATEGTTTWATFNTALTHTVAADQSATGAYEQSDLLYAVKHNIEKSSTAQQLDFHHLLAKVEVYLIRGDGLTIADIQGTTVKILDTKLTASVTLSKTSEDASTIAATGSVTDHNIITTRQQTGDETIQVPDPNNPGSTISEHAYGLAEAVIVPQHYDTNYDGTGTGMSLLQVTLPNGTQMTTPAATYNFLQGKRYVFNLTVNAREIRLSGEITNWTGATTSDITVY